MKDVEAFLEVRQPPARRLLYEVSVPTTAEELLRGTSVNGQKDQSTSDRGQLIKTGFQPISLNMFQHVNAGNEISRARLAVFRKRGIIREIVEGAATS